MAFFCVPYSDRNISSESEKFKLYSVEARIKKNDPFPSWNIEPPVPHCDEIEKKFEGLKEYYWERHNEKCLIYFNLETLSLSPPKAISKLDARTASVCLGIFLAAEKQLRGREFKEDWKLICITGDVEYDKTNKRIRLESVSDIKNKYKDEFEAIAEKTDGKCLFLYVSDKTPEENGVPDGESLGEKHNITVKHFISDDKTTISHIMAYLFMKEQRQFDLLEHMKNNKKFKFNITYQKDEKFNELKQKIRNDCAGFFIHGERGSGKSALAMEIAHNLFNMDEIYAPILIGMNNGDVKKRIEKDIEGMNNGKKSYELAKYLVSNIVKQISEADNAAEGKRAQQKAKTLIDREFSFEKYLVVIDDLPLREKDIEHIMNTIDIIFNNVRNRPYLIFTSANKCTNLGFIKKFGLAEIKPAVLDKEMLAKVFLDAANASDTIKNKINIAKDNGTFSILVETMFSEKFGHNPESAINTFLLLQGRAGIDRLLEIVKKKHSRYEEEIRGRQVNSRLEYFSYLNDLQKKLLYLFLKIGSGNPIYEDEILEKITETENWDEMPTYDALSEALDVLFDYNIINTIPKKNKTACMIEDIPFRIFLFEEEFLHSDPTKEDFMRDVIVDIRLQLEEALEYDMDTDIIKPLLERMNVNKIDIYDMHFLSACKYSTRPEVFSLLRDSDCDPYTYDDLGRHAFLYALVGNNKIALDWLLKYVPELLNQTDNDKRTVFHYAVNGGNVVFLDWLYSNASELLKCKDIDGQTIFHHAVNNDNVVVLDWLYGKVPELLSHVDNNKLTVFHSAVMVFNAEKWHWFKDAIVVNFPIVSEVLNHDKLEHFVTHSDIYFSETVDNLFESYNPDRTINLNWLWKHASELIEHIDCMGSTVFHFAVSFGNIAVLDWLLEYAPILLNKTANGGETVFHAASITGGNIENLNWLLKHAKKEILNYTNALGETAFHWAARFGNKEILDWFWEHSRELLNRASNNGETVYHCAASWGNTKALGWLSEYMPGLVIETDKAGRTVFHHAVKSGNTDVFDWLLKYKPELLNCKDGNDGTVFHYAAGFGNVAVLAWLYEHVPEQLSHIHKNGETVFHIAARYGNTDALDWLWEHAPMLLTQDNHFCATAFHLAATQRNTIVLDWFLEHASTMIDRLDALGATASHYAARWGSVAVLIWLLEYAPIQLIRLDNDGLTIFDYANEFRNTDVLYWLSDHEAEINNSMSNFTENDIVWNWLVKHESEVLLFYSGIYRAAKLGNRAILDWFLNHFPDRLNSADDNGYTLWHSAAGNGHTDVLDWFFVNAKELLYQADNNGMTVCHYAALGGQVAVLDWLFINARGLFSQVDNNGCTVWHAAVYSGDTIPLDWLLANLKGLLGQKDNDKETAFQLAISEEKSDVLDWFKKFAPEFVEEYSDPPINEWKVFCEAMTTGNIAMLDWLFENANEFFHQNDDGSGRNVFHYAALEGQVAVLDWLLKHTRELLAQKDGEGNTVFHYAVGNKNVNVLDWVFIHAPELLNHTNNNGWTVFYTVAANGNIAVLDWLYAHIPELLGHVEKTKGATVFHTAARNSAIVILDWLFERVPELIKSKTSDGQTVACSAIRSGDTKVLDWIFAHAPKLFEGIDDDGNTIFQVALLEENTDMLDWFIKHASELLKYTSNSGRTILHEAAATGDTYLLNRFCIHVPELLTELLSQKDNGGRSVFHYAAHYGPVLNWLYHHVPELLKTADNNGCTVFHAAATNRNTAILDWLHDKAKELLYQADNDGLTVCHYATLGGHIAVLDWLLVNAKELFSQVDNNGCTVWHAAVYSGDIILLDWLLASLKGLLGQKDNDKETAFQLAASEGNTVVLDWFKKRVPELCIN